MKRGTKRQRDGNKFSRLLRAGRVPKFRKPGTHSGQCAHVEFGVCAECRDWRARLISPMPARKGGTLVSSMPLHKG